MQQNQRLDRSWALLFARLVLGLIFFMAGFWKVFSLGPLQHARKYFLPFADTFLPIWSLWTVGVVIPFIELLAGALVIIGLRTREALVALGLVLAVVTTTMPRIVDFDAELAKLTMFRGRTPESTSAEACLPADARSLVHRGPSV